MLAALTAISIPIWTGAVSPEGPDPHAAGRSFALQACSDCHVVAQDQRSPPLLSQHAPSFSEIGNRPDITAASIKGFLNTTNWDRHSYPIKMPSMRLTSDQEDLVAGYILSLKGGRFSSPPLPASGERSSAQTTECMDKCVSNAYSSCYIGYCIRTDSMFHWIEKTSSVIKRCQAQCPRP
jgi:hypothetical protein